MDISGKRSVLCKLGSSIQLAFTHDAHYYSKQAALVFHFLKKEDDMPYSDFKALDQVHKTLGINIKSENALYTHIIPVKLSLVCGNHENVLYKSCADQYRT